MEVPKFSWLRVAQIGCIGVAIIFALVSFLGAQSQADEYRQQANELEAELAQLDSRMAKATKSDVDDVGDVSQELVFTSDLAVEIAEFETGIHDEHDADKVIAGQTFMDERLTVAEHDRDIVWFRGVEDIITWTSYATYDKSSDVCSGIWIATSDTDGAVLGYVMGTHVADDNRFGNLRFALTEAGKERFNDLAGTVDGRGLDEQ